MAAPSTTVRWWWCRSAEAATRCVPLDRFFFFFDSLVTWLRSGAPHPFFLLLILCLPFVVLFPFPPFRTSFLFPCAVVCFFFLCEWVGEWVGAYCTVHTVHGRAARGAVRTYGRADPFVRVCPARFPSERARVRSGGCACGVAVFFFFCGRLPLVLARAHSPRASWGAGTGLVGDAPTGPSLGRAHPPYFCFVVLFLYGRSAADTRGENLLFCSFLCGRCWWWRIWLWGWRQFSWCAPPLWVTPARARRAHPLTASLRCR